jgi:hypothetical protein
MVCINENMIRTILCLLITTHLTIRVHTPAPHSLIESFISRFAKTHKNWTQDDISISYINKVFSDTLEKFYQIHKDALENLPLRLAGIIDSGQGRRYIAFECQNKFIDGKEIRAHVYNFQPTIDIQTLAVGNYYYLHGLIKEANVRNRTGYNKTDNTCDIGIIYFDLADMIPENKKNHP